MRRRWSIAVLGLAPVLLLFWLSSRSFSQQTARSQNDPRPVAQAALRQGEIRIDGLLDETAWSAATPITELTQSSPDEGKPRGKRKDSGFLNMTEPITTAPGISKF